jgi:hypothetical protein
MELNERKRKTFPKQHNLFRTNLTDIAGKKRYISTCKEY